MQHSRRYSKVAFVFGLVIGAGFPLAARRFPILHAAVVYAVSIGTLLCLPFIFLKMKNDAVAAKRSDAIGYAVIFGVVVAVGGVAYAILK